MKKPLRAAFAIPLLALAGATYAGPDQATAQTTTSAPVASPSPASARVSQARSKTAQAQAAPSPARKPAGGLLLDLRPPNFASSEWQQRLQGPTIDHSMDYAEMESVVVTPAAETPNLTVASAGLGSLYWAF